MRKILLLITLLFCTAAMKAKDFRIPKDGNVKILVSETDAPVVRTALSILEKDIQTLTDKYIKKVEDVCAKKSRDLMKL